MCVCGYAYIYVIKSTCKNQPKSMRYVSFNVCNQHNFATNMLHQVYSYVYMYLYIFRNITYIYWVFSDWNIHAYVACDLQ